MFLLHLTQVEQAAVDRGSLGQLLPYCAAAFAPLAACSRLGSYATEKHILLQYWNALFSFWCAL